MPGGRHASICMIVMVGRICRETSLVGPELGTDFRVGLGLQTVPAESVLSDFHVDFPSEFELRMHRAWRCDAKGSLRVGRSCSSGSAPFV